MAQNKNSQQVEETDYSGFFKKPGQDTKAVVEPVSPLEELPVRKAFSRKLKYLIFVLILLALAQGIYIYILDKSKNPPLPEGYELISPENGPPVISPIK